MKIHLPAGWCGAIGNGDSGGSGGLELLCGGELNGERLEHQPVISGDAVAKALLMHGLKGSNQFADLQMLGPRQGQGLISPRVTQV